MGIDGSWNSVTNIEKETDAKVAYGYTCPVCGGEVVRRCKCSKADSLCERGHEFFKNDEGGWSIGKASH